MSQQLRTDSIGRRARGTVRAAMTADRIDFQRHSTLAKLLSVAVFTPS
jgi:hypothetical protein